MDSSDTTIRRCIALPVHSAEGMDNRALWELLGKCWEQSTALANWCVQRCLRHDVVRTPQMKTVKDFPKWAKFPDSGPSVHFDKVRRGLYGLAIHELGAGRNGDFWDGAMSSVASITNRIETRWKTQDRFKVLWKRDQSALTYRYPYPFPVPAKCWAARFVGKPAVDVSLPGGLGRVTLHLRGGPEFARQVALLRQITAGTLKQSELTITRQRCHASHRPQMQTKGAQRESWRAMVRIMVEQEVKARDGDRVLTLCTDPEALWVAELDGRRAWVLNADHIQRAVAWLAKHESRRQRWAQDCKAERRADPRHLARFNHVREKACDKHARRMSSWLHETAAHLVRFAVRQRVGCVLYRNIDRGFSPSFPWHRLNLLLAEKLQAEGIRLETATDEAEAVA